MGNIPELDSETLSRVLEQAEKVKAYLLERALGQRKSSVRCSCGAIHTHAAEVVNIDYFCGECSPRQIGLFPHWNVWMRTVGNYHHSDYDYTLELDAFFQRAELYPLFRAAFEQLGVPTNHLSAQLSHSTKGLQPSGAIAKVSLESPVFFRPVGDVTNSVWTDGVVRISRDVPKYGKGPFLSCDIDPLGVHYNGGPNENTREYFKLQPGTFATLVTDQVTPIPLVSVYDVDVEAGTAVVETDVNVELFDNVVITLR